ncbi:helix-turn-helix domain-containing protein [Pseudotamlana agarivorans]|uniref:helix-turn-helix domain-containing protein n=1 Tax=Pseudotamlana agarivorans TaxID=481183 RepID=UPI00083735F3|nr:helix-turn-helix domain-containing protein [Tamlana agarivorans]
MEYEFSHNDLPAAVTLLNKKVDKLTSMLFARQESQPATQAVESWKDLNWLLDYDPEKRAKSTWYSKISRNEVPYYKRGKKIYFLKSEIDEWLKGGKVKTNANIKTDVDNLLSK